MLIQICYFTFFLGTHKKLLAGDKFMPEMNLRQPKFT